MPQISTEDSGILQLTKTRKTNNNVVGYHLVSRHVISTPSDVQLVYRCSKMTFILSQKTCFSFKYVIIATYICHKKRKLTYVSGAKPGTEQFYICYHKNYYATLMLLEKLYYMKTIKFQGPSMEQTPRKVLGQGLHFTTQYHTPSFYRSFSHTLFSKLKMQKLTIILGAIIWSVFVQYPHPQMFSLCSIHTLRCLACVDCVDSSAKSSSSINFSEYFLL